MGTSRSSGSGMGCVGVFLGIGFTIAVILVAILFFFKRVTPSTTSETSVDLTVMIDAVDLSDYTVPNFTAEPSSENFIAIMRAQNTTTLAKKTLIDAANGKSVTWTMRVNELKETGSNPDEDKPSWINGTFEIPFLFKTGNRATGSALRVQASFPTTETSALLELRKEDWVKISGTLSIDDPSGNQVTLKNPKIAHEAAEAIDADSN